MRPAMALAASVDGLANQRASGLEGAWEISVDCARADLVRSDGCSRLASHHGSISTRSLKVWMTASAASVRRWSTCNDLHRRKPSSNKTP